MSDSQAVDLPALAVLYEADSVSPLRLSTAARGSFRLVWVLDEQTEATPVAVRLLRRFGVVVNVHGLDAAAAAGLVRAHDPDGITAFSDQQLYRTACIAAELGLPFFSPEVAKRLTTKNLQRQVLRDAGIDVPAFRAIAAGTSVSALPELVGDLPFPAVFKPESGGASRDTYFVADLDALCERLRLLREQGRCEDMILEQYLVGRADLQDDLMADYVSVETVVAGGVATAVAISGRPRPAEPFRETGTVIPSTLNEDDQHAVVGASIAAVTALGVTIGALHTEIKLTPDGPRIVEVNGRVGGGGVPDLFEMVTGESLLRLAAHVALGRPSPFSSLVPTKGVAYFFAWQPPMDARRLERLEGVSELSDLPGVERVDLNVRVGDAIDTSRGSYSYLFTMLGVAEDHVAMRGLHREMVRTVKVSYS